MSVNIPQLTLVTAAFAATMENSLVVSQLVKWRPSKNRTSDPLQRFSYVERVPDRLNVRRWKDSVSDLSAARQNRVVGSEVYRLDSGITLDYDYADFAHIRDEDQAYRNERLRQDAMRSAENVDADILNVLTTCGNNWIGNPGNAIASLDPLMLAYARLKEEGVPDQDLIAVLSYTDLPPLSKYLLETVTSASETQESIITRFQPANTKLRGLAGMRVMFTQQLPVQRTGTANRATSVLGTGPFVVDYATVAQSTVRNGEFLSQTIPMVIGTGTEFILPGEVFTIAGVFAYDNRKEASLGRLQEFTVLPNPATPDGRWTATGGAVSPRIYPALIRPTATLTGTAGVNRAHATVTTDPANGAQVTWKGAANSEYLIRAVVSRSCIRVETAELEDLSGAENSRRRMMAVPLSVRMVKQSDVKTGQTICRLDASYTPNIEAYGRNQSVRINGA